MAAAAMSSNPENPIEDVLKALTDRESDLELKLDGIEIQFPFLRDPLRVRGTLTLRLNMREVPPSGPRGRRRT